MIPFNTLIVTLGGKLRLFQVLFCTISKYKKAQFLALKLRNWAFIVAPEKRPIVED